MKNISLIIPTYRPAHVSRTVDAYASNFAKYGREVPIVIFDDCPYEVSREHIPAIAAIKNRGGLFYVSAHEKERFLADLSSRVGNESLLRKIFRPSYGGNRNFTVAYTLGEHFISVDDDMRPHGLMSTEYSLLSDSEVASGFFAHYRNAAYEKIEFDIVHAFRNVLGKKAGELAGFCRTGHTIHDTLTDMHTNTTLGEIVEGRENVLFLDGVPNPDAVVKLAQTYRTGSSDVDAYDYAQQFLKEDGPRLLAINDMALKYVIKGFLPCVTASNWRIDCGVSGYDNTEGLPPFLPTKLRCEDYGNRLWTQGDDVATAHVAAVQTHYRDPYNRQSIPKDFHNEAHANYLKDVLRQSLDSIEGIVLKFHEGWTVDPKVSEGLVESARELYLKAMEMADQNPSFQGEYLDFAHDFHEAYNGFDADVFYAKMSERIALEASLIQDTMEVWPAVVEEVFKMKQSGQLPMRSL